MASITKTKTSKGERRYVVRYRHNGGKSREEWFERWADAKNCAATTEADKKRGSPQPHTPVHFEGIGLL